MKPDKKVESRMSETEFLRLFVQNESILRAYARSILSDWNAVDDAIQEASVTMWEKLWQLQGEDGFLPWAKVILRFKCLSAAAANRGRRPLLSDATLKLLADEADAIDTDMIQDLRGALSKCLAIGHQDYAINFKRDLVDVAGCELADFRSVF